VNRCLDPLFIKETCQMDPERQFCWWKLQFRVYAEC